jgi:hypothetical protein
MQILMTTKDACKYLKISRITLWKLTKFDLCKNWRIKIGAKNMYQKNNIDNVLNELKEGKRINMKTGVIENL